MSELHLRPGIRASAYPQQQESELTPFEQSAARLLGRLKKPLTRRRHRLGYVNGEVERYEKPLLDASDAQLGGLITDPVGVYEPLVRQGSASVDVETLAAASETVAEPPWMTAL